MATLWLEHDERGNTLSAAMVETLLELARAAGADMAAHTLLLRSSGRHFCTGFDLGNLEAQSDSDLLGRFVRIEMLLDAIWRAPLRTIALCASRYAFLGAGFGLVLGTRRLAARVGMQRTHSLTCEGEVLDAGQALQAGLASHTAATPEESETLLATLVRSPRATRNRGRLPCCCHGQHPQRRRPGRTGAAAAEPGLKQRITQYPQAQLARAAKTAQ